MRPEYRSAENLQDGIREASGLPLQEVLPRTEMERFPLLAVRCTVLAHAVAADSGSRVTGRLEKSADVPGACHDGHRCAGDVALSDLAGPLRHWRRRVRDVHPA